MPIVDIHSSSIIRQSCSDQVEKRKKPSRRMPFKSLSTNTPSKPKPAGKPVKGSSLLRSYSAPMPQSPSLEVANQDNDQEQIVVPQSEKIKIFRTTSDEVDEELEDMWTLKRANPVFDEDDDDFEVSPSKRARTFTYFDAVPESRDDELSEPQLISWSSRVNEDKYGFNLGN